jgi:hypothetical protein
MKKKKTSQHYKEPPKKSIILEGLVIPFSDKPNLNGRIYTKDSIQNYDSFKELVTNHRIYGSLGQDDFLNSSNVSHEIIDVSLNENGITGKIKILNTPAGDLVLKLLKENLQFSIRPRGVGTVDSSGYVHLDELLSFDIIPKEEDAFCEIDNYSLRQLGYVDASGYAHETEIISLDPI